MRPRAGARWKAWLPVLLFVPIGACLLPAWLSPANVASWLQVLSFCG